MAAHRRLLIGRSPLLSKAIVPWLPMMAGVVIMSGYVLYAVSLTVDTAPPPALPNEPVPIGEASAPTRPAPLEADAGPESVPGGGAGQAQSALNQPDSVTEPPPPSGPITMPPSPATPPAPDVVGEYRLDATYEDGFISQVAIVNHSEQSQDWTVELAFLSNVGSLNAFWVDGTPQPTSQRSGQRYVFTSTVPVEASAKVVLKVHFDRTGADADPTICTVNGAPCTGV